MMFSTKSKEPIETTGSTATIIGSGVTLTGDITSSADVRIDGTIKGNVYCAARVLIGAQGLVEGNIDCRQADIMGKIKGNIKAKELVSLREKAILSGDIFTIKLHVEPSANFNGRCTMTAGNVVNLIDTEKDKPEDQKARAAH